MKVLVTGGAGFIGSNLVKQLVSDGIDVRVLDNLMSGFRSNLDPFPEIRFIEGDIRDDAAVAEAINGVEVVFHLAASVGNKRSIDCPIEDSQINVIGTLRLLEAARKAKVRKVVFSSSAGIFGELRTLPIREDHPVEPDSPYGTSKLAAEKMCLVYSRLYGIECICLRYFNVYGPNQRYDAYGNVIPIFAYRLIQGLPMIIFGDGEQTRDFINVKDVVQANYKAAFVTGLSGAYNIASGSRITVNELAKKMIDASGIQGKIEYGPPRGGDVRHSLADISAAQKDLGFNPVISLEEGLREYMNWAKREMTIGG